MGFISKRLAERLLGFFIFSAPGTMLFDYLPTYLPMHCVGVFFFFSTMSIV